MDSDEFADSPVSNQTSIPAAIVIPGPPSQPPRSLRHLFEDASAPLDQGLRTPISALPRPFPNGSNPILVPPPIPIPDDPEPQKESIDARTARPTDFVSFLQRPGTPPNLSPPSTPKMEAPDPFSTGLLSSPNRRKHDVRENGTSNVASPTPPLLSLEIAPIRRSSLSPTPPDDTDIDSTHRSPPQHARYQHQPRDDNGLPTPRKTASPLKFRFPSPANSSSGHHLPALSPVPTPTSAPASSLQSAPSQFALASDISSTMNSPHILNGRSPEPSFSHLPNNHSSDTGRAGRDKPPQLVRSPNLPPSSRSESVLSNYPASGPTRKQVITRQSSVAVMESAGGTTLVSRVSARPDRNVSGSRSDGEYVGGSTLAVPKFTMGIGLRDVLKVRLHYTPCGEFELILSALFGSCYLRRMRS